ncbi:MAG: carbohydrate ABC transporter permease, partial [Anaerolineales bacterium]
MTATRRKLLSNILVNGTLGLVVLLWTIPTLGVLVSSFRTRFDIQTSGWWSIFPHREWMQVDVYEPGDDLDRDGLMTFEGVTATFEEFRAGVDTGRGTRVSWVGNKRLGRIEVQEQRWTMRTDFTLEN